jgi:4-amino-4-deoxy-L-arabinose transferase-like glycosyltransferase
LQNEKYFWHWGILLGLLLETKFTTLYVVVAMLLYVAVRERRLFKVKKFYYALGIAAVIFLPQVLYNVLMQQATGHFALQLARLFNQPSSPWHLTGASTSPLQGAFQSVFNLGQLFSWPTLLVSIGAVAYVFAKRTERWLLGLPLIFLLLEDATIGSKDLWSIFLAPVIAVAAYDIYQKIKSTPSSNVLPTICSSPLGKSAK